MTIISATSGKAYDVDLSKNYCTCPAWKFQHVRAELRSCKHLEQVRAEARADRTGLRNGRRAA